MNKLSKVIASLVAVLVVIGVAVAVVVVVVHQKKADGDNNKEKPLAAGSSLADRLCANTNYKEACLESLSPVANNMTADYKDYINAVLNATAVQLSKSLNLSESLLVEAKDETAPRVKMSLEDCRELLRLSTANLETVFSQVGDSNVHTINERSAELKSWLGSLITYSETCLDGVEDPKFHGRLNETLRNSSALTDNSLAVVSAVTNTLDQFGLKLNPKALGARRLLDNHGEYPTWLSAGDRRLLAGGVTPNAVVAKDGSGQYTSIGAALAAYPGNLGGGRYVIYVKAGKYDEYITVESSQVNIFMYGDGADKTIVTGKKSYTGGFTTYKTSSFSVQGKGFMCKDMGFENTAGPEGHQAVALRVQSEWSVFYKCRVDGYQDSLYVQAGHQFFRECVITGTIDFIFGDATVVIQKSDILVRRPMSNQLNAVTAQGRSQPHQESGIVIHNCRIMADDKLLPVKSIIKTYLGRPWKEFSRTVIMESTLDDLIQPEGWYPWQGTFALDTLYYAEYANRGAGAATNRRVSWKGFHVISRPEALPFAASSFIAANSWLPATGTPFDASLLA